MAIIATDSKKADVTAMGSAMDATVNLNGALMEMLSTVYAFILMSAIREAIQNACDASRRAGLSFAEGVLVQLPTIANPMITVIDKGSGMTQTFMEDPNGYLSFGKSTKEGDNNAAGGLGVGRWAAYGYIRECYITTCHESDMVERTYFQFQGDGLKPRVQKASEVPGSVVGTRVYFPVKETDIAEALRAVAWLKEVMQLTMGDSFTVDNLGALPTMLPEFSGTVLDLGTVDSGLKGVRVYPMKGSNLKYHRQGTQKGSLLVMTNKEFGVGGLPFHVQTPTDVESVFEEGMVVEVPMSFKIPFMPSREEIKYTDEVNELLKRIDAAAGKAVVAKAQELYSLPGLTPRALLSNLLGNTEAWHWFAKSTRQQYIKNTPQEKIEYVLNKTLKTATGGYEWNGKLRMPISASGDDLKLKYTSKGSGTMRAAYVVSGRIAIPAEKGSYVAQTFIANDPVILLVDDMKSGGTQRARAWVNNNKHRQFIFFASTVAGEAKAAADSVSKAFLGELEIILTSKMPDVPREAGSRSSVSRRAALTYFSVKADKQVTEPMNMMAISTTEPVRVWLEKDGGALAGFAKDSQLGHLHASYGSEGGLEHILEAVKVDRLYLLNPKQAAELRQAIDEADAEGLLEMSEADFIDNEIDEATIAEVKALKSWKPVEALLSELVARPDVQNVLAGKKVRQVSECWQFTNLCEMLAKSPRLELTGTQFDKEISPHVDLLTGTTKLHKSAIVNQNFGKLCGGLIRFGNHLAAQPTDTKDRTELLDSLERLKHQGMVNYDLVYRNLLTRFPLLRMMTTSNGAAPADAVKDLCVALAAVYR